MALIVIPKARGVPFLIEWNDLAASHDTDHGDIGDNLEPEGYKVILTDKDQTRIYEAISSLGDGISDSIDDIITNITDLGTGLSNLGDGLDTLGIGLNNEATARQQYDSYLEGLINIQSNRVDNLLYDPIQENDVLDGKRIYLDEFLEVFSTDQVDGLEQRFALFSNVLNGKMSDISATPGTGITIDKSNPAFPIIVSNNPNWNNIQNLPANLLNIDSSLLSKEDKNQKGIPDGYASLDSQGKLPSAQLPAHVHGIAQIPGLQDALDFIDNKTFDMNSLWDAPEGAAQLDTNAKIKLAQLNTDQANGIPILDANGKIKTAQLPDIGGFPTGTRMLFQQSTAPTGWTKIVDSTIDNSAIRIVTGAAGNGGANAFTSVLNASVSTAGGAVQAHTLTLGQIPSHNHGGGSHNHTIPVSLSTATGTNVVGAHQGYTGDWFVSDSGTIITTQGGDQSHSHGFTNPNFNLNVKYTDVIIAEKD